MFPRAVLGDVHIRIQDDSAPLAGVAQPAPAVSGRILSSEPTGKDKYRPLGVLRA
jgi:hypothetical protein